MNKSFNDHQNYLFDNVIKIFLYNKIKLNSKNKFPLTDEPK